MITSNHHHNAEKRSEMRIDATETVYLELTSASYDGKDPARISITESIDISANGLRATTKEPLSQGRLLQIVVQSRESSQRLKLVAEVKWCTALLQNSHYEVGLEVLESDGTDVAEWKSWVANRLSHLE
ncbi:PilZ domain-containing protein [Marinibactrum halimedae]|nr:PilZ domain-containing protein [Marinibactrum halimedae]MCD9459425.1 PilZ domain-containing protein [Marinibactrum halimedae]